MNQKIQSVLNGTNGNYIFPFFWLHGESEEVLREYMRVIQGSSIRAVCVESRPHPDFCGDGWWHDMDIILDEARNRGMKVWILDDSHFPTGYANGAMASQPDELCRQSLVCRSISVKGSEPLHLSADELVHPVPFEKNMAEQYLLTAPQRSFDDDRLLSVSAWNTEKGTMLNLQGEIREGELNWTAPAGNWTVYLLHTSRNYGYHRDYINMMDKRSCRVLIDAVYEPHYARYARDFGTTIAGFFSDEPELGNGHLYDTNDPFGGAHDYPWSTELEERLKTTLGTDYTLQLPLLWEGNADAEETARLRCAYMDAVTELVKEDFSEQLGTWCREHGVQYIGHMIEDDNHHSRTGCSLGHYFRGLAGQDMAGIDDIGGQVFPQGEEISYFHNIFAHRDGEFYHYLLGKLADSAAAIDPQKNGSSMCEIFGNYGWSEGVRLEKYLIDHFLVRGINHFVPHAFSAKDYPDPDCPPHFYAHGHNPQYRHFGALMTYTNRLCELMNDGRHIASAAVLYHAEGDWTGKHMTTDKVGHQLFDGQIDYDLIPADVFADRAYYHTSIENGELHVGSQCYRAFILPYQQFIPAEVAKAVADMKQAGIPVFVIDSMPEGICRGEAAMPDMTVICLEELIPELERIGVRDICISPANNRIRCRRYIHEDKTEIYLFINEGTENYKGTVFLPDLNEKTSYRYDAWNNKLYDVKLNGRQLPLCIEPLHSFVLVLDPGAGPDKLQPESATELSQAQKLTFSSPWYRSICRSTEYPAFGEEKEISFPDHLAEEEPKFSGYVRYRNQIEICREQRLFLEITDAHEGVEVFLNGRSLGIQIVPPFHYELTSALQEGINEISIEVATTLERENSGIPDVTGQVKEPTAHSGITGEVYLLSLVP